MYLMNGIRIAKWMENLEAINKIEEAEEATSGLVKLEFSQKQASVYCGNFNFAMKSS